jgi:protein-disulfide isomerase
MSKPKNSLNPLIVGAVVLILAFFGYKYYKNQQVNKIKNDILPKALKKAINNDKTQFTIGAIREVSGLYEFDLTVNNQKFTSYISKDGKLLFPSVVKVDSATNVQGENDANKPNTNITLSQIKKLFSKDFIHFGDANKKVLFVEVSDPSCPYCHIAAGKNPELAKQVGSQFQYASDGGSYLPPVEEMKKLTDEGKASFVYLYSNGHGNGELAAQALYCAFEKNLFWPVHDKLMTNAGYTLLNEEIKTDKTKIAELTTFLANDIDSGFLTECLQSKKYESRLKRDEELAATLGFQGTPYFLINTKSFSGAYSFKEMQSTVDNLLK